MSKIGNLTEKERDKEFAKLEKENDELRDSITELIGVEDKKYFNEVWKLINNLVENEIQQEELCD